jgi:hypothetical protein
MKQYFHMSLLILSRKNFVNSLLVDTGPTLRLMVVRQRNVDRRTCSIQMVVRFKLDIKYS